MISTNCYLKNGHHFNEFKLYIPKVLETCWFLMNYKVIRLKIYLHQIYLIKFIILLDISERDLIYTETLMRRGIENYENKEIIILGKKMINTYLNLCKWLSFSESTKHLSTNFFLSYRFLLKHWFGKTQQGHSNHLVTLIISKR